MKRHLFVSMLVITVVLVASVASAFTVSAQTYETIVVQKGDSLSKIASRYCTTWQEIYRINHDAIGKDPNVVIPGTVLTVPNHCGWNTGDPHDQGPRTHATGTFRAPYYTVAWGDALSSIGLRFGGISAGEIESANGLKNDKIYAGHTLIIPGTTGSGSVQPPSAAVPERVYFSPGGISTTRSGVIQSGVAKQYILTARAGQTMEINTQSHGEPLTVTLSKANGQVIPLNGENNKIQDNLFAKVPATGDYFVTVLPVVLPESPSLGFNITFVIQ